MEDCVYMSSIKVESEVESVESVVQRLKDLGCLFVEHSIVQFGKKIAKGGQGVVYEASVSWPYMDKATKVAVKKFASNHGVFRGHYPLELWTKHHFQVVQPRAFFVDKDASLCMIMALYRGDLRSIIDTEMKKKSGPPFKDMISFGITIQLAKGMAELHSLGICHRDLKAGNVLVSVSVPVDTEADLIHMHLCAIADYESSEHVRGTAFWRAPEVLESTTSGIPLTDLQWRAADVYSFGMMCYEIVTGEEPFKGVKFSNYDIVINGERPMIPEYVPELLSKIITDCWNPNPECRPDFDEILGALILKAQKHPLLGDIITSWKLTEGLIESNSENIDLELMQFRELLRRELSWNDACVDDRNYASWGLKYVDFVEEFIELLRKEHDVHQMMTFVDYIESQKLLVLMSNSYFGFFSSLTAAVDMEQANQDMNLIHGLCVKDKTKILVLAKDISMKLQKDILITIQKIGLYNNDSSLALKEKLKIVDDFVTQVKVTLDENATFQLIDHILAKMDSSGTNDEIAIFQRHMKFKTRCTTFEKNYNTYLIFEIIMLYILYTSPYCNYIIFQIFGVELSDIYDIYLGFLCPLVVPILYNGLVSRFPNYRSYFILLKWTFILYNFYSHFRRYGFIRQVGWLGFWNSFGYGYFFYGMILKLLEYLYVRIIRMRASSPFLKRKDE